jgi:serine/threonine protein kinase
MSSDFTAQPAGGFTEQQSPADLQRSKELSLERTQPPTEVPGYEAQRFLGSGAYGEVWVGIDRNTRRKVAIKFYAHRRGVDWALLAREVEKLRFLSADRYVVQLLDVGWEAEPPYYVMEFVENGSLDDLLRRHGTFSVPEAVEMFREIAVGLSHAHGKGVVHCDLKPANILLDQDHRPRLADFGQSRLSHEQKPALGTLFYMAPEQADLDAAPDVRWDVYALGAILYTLLVGSPPHRNDAVADEMASAEDLADRLARYRHAIRTAPPPVEHRKLPGIDKALAEIIDRCLAVNPDDRFANVQEVLDALAARDRAKERLPMLMLGFLGPLIVLLITALFSWRGYNQAVQIAEADSTQNAIENNQYAANLAAEKVTSEIGRYFRLAAEEANSAGFWPKFFEVVDTSPNLAILANAQTRESELAPARAAFYEELERRALDSYLLERLKTYQRQAERDERAPRFASIFVTDRVGTQIASAFDDESVSKSIGANWAHRTYFHGGPIELPEFPRPQPNARHIDQTHLSAVFLSTTQKKWKVAISTPIYREDPEKAGRQVFEGILVLTVNLGDFEISHTDPSAVRDRFAVLVDGRPGDDQGTILQHPLYEELQADLGFLPQEFFGKEYRVPVALLAPGAGQLYEDPLSKYPAATGADVNAKIQALASEYDRQWLAAAAPVLPPIGAGEHSQSGLIVLVQSDYQTAVQPARQLGKKFMRNSFWMLVVMAAVSLGLWYIVVRTFREPRAGLKRRATPTPESTPLHGMTTIAAGRKD